MATQQDTVLIVAQDEGLSTARFARFVIGEIRDQQTVARDERGVAAIVETDGRQPQVIEPRGGRIEPVPVAPLRSRRVVKGPHPFAALD